jgi:hypothetical protein
MSSAITSSGAAGDGTRSQPLLDPVGVGAILVGFAILAIGVRALGSGHPYDFGFYYRGAAAAWEHGDPTVVDGWLGTPFMAAVLAPLTAHFTMGQLAVALSFVNLALLIIGCLLVTRALTPACGRGAAFAIAASVTVLFAPAVSTVWWRQFNVIVVALAVAGFLRLRRGHATSACLLIGVSVALKPLVVLVPIALLLRRETRRVGLASLILIAALTVGAQAVLVTRGAPVASLSPARIVRDSTERMSDPAGSHACHPANLSPGAFLCRTVGTDHWNVQRAVALVIAIVVAAALLVAVRRYPARSFEYFAVAAGASVLFGPIEWTHYQVALVPLIAVTTLHLWRRPRMVPLVALVLAVLTLGLVWSPSMVVADFAARVAGGSSLDASFVLMRVTAYAQLALFAIAAFVLRADEPRTETPPLRTVEQAR